MNILSSEPTLIIGFVEAGVVLAVSFGAPISPDQKAGIIGLVSAALMVAGAILNRAQVVPKSRAK